MYSLESSVFTLGVLFSIIHASLLLARAEAVCSEYTRCDECLIRDPSCAWCDDTDVLMSFARNSSSSLPAQLCGSPEELAALNCARIVNPPSRIISTGPGDGVVSSTSYSLTLRPGELGEFIVSVSPPERSMVDMYLILDLTFTMESIIQALQSLALRLVTEMQGVTSRFRIGIGSFVDKPINPYVDRVNDVDPCAGSSYSGTCELAYSFRHVLNLTSNATVFSEALFQLQLSASLDAPESTLDAILQSSVCEAEIGWDERGQSQRIIVVFTDGDYHYALDGRIGGLQPQPSYTSCQLDPLTHEYSTSHLHDFPSASLLSDVLDANLITPIFAVTSNVLEIYQNLALRGASVGVLAPNPDVILALIQEQYRILRGTIVPVLSTGDYEDYLNITVSPANNCHPGNVSASAPDVCVNAQSPAMVEYSVTVRASPEACQNSLPITTLLQFIRFGTVSIAVDVICGCSCSVSAVENSAVCSSQGTLECSTCICNQDTNLGGAVCECPLDASSTGCRDPSDGEGRVCNGRGTCNCGNCQCDQVNSDSTLTFQGDYCQFEPQDCPLGRDESGTFRPCAGNGVCNSVTVCECAEGYTGGACDCSKDNSTCVRPREMGEMEEEEEEEEEELCSGMGSCICGQCICHNYSVSFGSYCEGCLPCRTSCSKVSPCVLCMLMEGAVCPPELDCSDRIHIDDVANMTSTQDMKVCSLREDSCEVRYFLSTNIVGDEDSVQVYLDHSQRSLVTLQEGSTDCNPSTPIWPIFVGIILGTIVVGVLVIVLWRCFTYLGEYLEYQQWSKSIKDSTERSGENPLFVDPTSEYSNPRYRNVYSS